MVKVFRLLFVASLASIIGCASASSGTPSSSGDPPHPTQKEAEQEFAGAFCGVAIMCDAAIKAKYNGSQQACVTDVVTKDAPTDAREPCDQSQVDQCTKDTNAMSCDDMNAVINGDMSKQPASCKGC